ncbi:MAG TPA: hypothetical protein EYP68_04570 [Candidatus Korarchaeota archaeon]|nr:hypothetical protein [Candidatus Korarchaeota archaeon]
MGIVLQAPKEPHEIKDLIKSVRSKLGTNRNIKYDSFAVWSFNQLPKYLWKSWKEILRENKVSWQDFLAILKLHTKDMIDWALHDRISWEELVSRITETIAQNFEEEV